MHRRLLTAGDIVLSSGELVGNILNHAVSSSRHVRSRQDLLYKLCTVSKVWSGEITRLLWAEMSVEFLFKKSTSTTYKKPLEPYMRATGFPEGSSAPISWDNLARRAHLCSRLRWSVSAVSYRGLTWDQKAFLVKYALKKLMHFTALTHFDAEDTRELAYQPRVLAPILKTVTHLELLQSTDEEFCAWTRHVPSLQSLSLEMFTIRGDLDASVRLSIKRLRLGRLLANPSYGALTTFFDWLWQRAATTLEAIILPPMGNEARLKLIFTNEPHIFPRLRLLQLAFEGLRDGSEIPFGVLPSASEQLVLVCEQKPGSGFCSSFYDDLAEYIGRAGTQRVSIHHSTDLMAWTRDAARFLRRIKPLCERAEMVDKRGRRISSETELLLFIGDRARTLDAGAEDLNVYRP